MTNPDKMAPNQFHSRYLTENKDTVLEKKILKPFVFLAEKHSGRILRIFGELIARWLKIPEGQCGAEIDVTFVSVLSSLLMDDIQDDGIMRRGAPASYRVFGVVNTLNSVNYVLDRVLIENIANLGSSKAMPLLFDCFIEALKGQRMEIYYRENSICPTEEQYLKISEQKTSAWFVLCASLMQLKSATGIDCVPYAIIFGQYCQVHNDYQDLSHPIYHSKKGFCRDITEGKFTFPIIHAIHNDPEKGLRIKNIMKRRTSDLRLLKECLRLIEECGSFEYTKRRLDEILKKLMEEKNKLGDNGLFDQSLKTLTTYYSA